MAERGSSELDADGSNQLADSSRAPCSVCYRPMPVTRLGLIRVHGPVNDRCPGSRSPPAGAPIPANHSTFNPSRPGVKILKRVPRASRDLGARKLATILDGVVKDNSAASWDRLIRFPARCLRAPKRGGHRRALASLTNQLIEEEGDPDPTQPGPQQQPHKPHQRSLESLATRIASKLEEGDFRGTVRLASSEDTIAAPNEDTLAALRAKHPAPHPDSSYPPAPSGEEVTPIQMSADEVGRAILSFPCASAAGPDGLRPQHLKDMIGRAAGGGGPLLLRSLSSFINMVLAGEVAPLARPFFFGASLIALNKKDGGVRPIAVGCTLRRLAAKCASSHVKQAMAALLAPHQLGYGTPQEAEAAVHASRMYLQNMKEGHLLLKLDFKNAFNCVRRDKMLAAVRERAPELFPLVHSAYCTPSSLFIGDTVIPSAEGVQQGDPLGPLLFCLSTMCIMEQLTSELYILYLDDCTLGGTVESVLHDLQTVEQEARQLGLQLNHSKSEVISEDRNTIAAVLEVAPDLCPVSPEQATLLGSPIGGQKGIDESINEKVEALRTMGNRLRYLHTHDAFCLLRHAFALPKVLYTLRTSPSFRSPHLKDFDLLLRSLLGDIANINITDNDMAWAQASLPVWSGGLGVRSATQLAPSAFLASAAGCTNIAHNLLPSRLRDSPYEAHKDALKVWGVGHAEPPPPVEVAHRQKLWDAPHVTATFKVIQDAAPDATALARLLAACRRESGAWLHTLPIASLGLRMDDEVVRVAMGLRLGATLCHPHECHLCGARVDCQGTHGLHCRKSLGRHPRHMAINDIIRRSLASAKVSAHLEPAGICRSDGKRPDGATVMPWRSGRVLVWDATCPDTFAPSHLQLASKEAGAVANQAEQQKRAKYAELAATHHFIPVAIETSGVFGKEAQAFLRELGRRIREETGEPLSFHYLQQRISVAIQRGNAAAVLGTTPPSNSDPIFFFFDS